MSVIDLRSDTVTLPTQEMRDAMARAPLGDDVYGEDPTVNRLQELAAEKLGKEAALFVTSGTMGNLAAILAHCGRGDEVILGDQSHTYLSEAGGISALGGIHPRSVPNQGDGTIAPADIVAAIRPDDPHFPKTRLICLENTHNRCHGAALTAEYGRQVADLARRHGLLLHLDGARLFNAAVALHVPAKELAAPFDSVTFCLSKALCAPAGSVICGSAEFIQRAHRIRKQLGGGMRQAGVLAAAGIIALEKMVERLADDHARARTLADQLSRVPGVRVEARPTSNMVYIHLEDEAALSEGEFVRQMHDQGVLFGKLGLGRFRLVIHYWINDAQLERAVQIFRQLLA